MTDRRITVSGPHRADPVRRARPAWALAHGVPAARAGRGRIDPLAGPLAHLRGAATRYARGLHAGGACPEQLLARVQALVAAALAAEGYDDPTAAGLLTAQVVRWSLAAHDAAGDGR